MINNNEILVFDFDFDKQLLLNEWNQHKDNTLPYTDKRFGKYTMNNWRIARDFELSYAEQLCKTFDIEALPKFYILHANTKLTMHTDSGTTCSINFLLSGTPAPVKYASGEQYTYTTALLNTGVKHGVDNGPEDRVLFKLSIKEEPFENVKQKVINTLSRS